MVKQLVSVVKASIWSVRCRTRLEEALNRVRRANVAMHHLGKSIKREQMLFIFTQAADSFGIAFLVFGLKSRQIEECILLLLLLEDPG